MRISIEAGGTTTQLGTEPVFQFKTASLEAVGNNITITPVIESDAADKEYIKSINGSQPNGKGEFFIDGSECVSWGEVKNGVVVGGRPDETAEHDGMWLVDLCPSCTTCENVYRLKYEVETLKMWINTLKDVNLYQDADVGQRRDNLNGLRVTGPAAGGIQDSFSRCGSGLQEDDQYLYVRGLQLLNQYITTVHMWNYLVQENNKSDLISIAPEDTAGFVIQTKRALPSCADEQTIQCIIDVGDPQIWEDGQAAPSDTGFPDDYPLSIFIPEKSKKLTFEALKNFKDIALNGATLSVSNINGSPSHKRISTPAIAAKVAGTYVVTVKLLPFVGYSIWRDVVVGGNTQREYISVRGGTATDITDVTGATHTGDTEYSFGISGHTATAYAYPTEADYLRAKTTPTASANFKLLWPISITWKIRKNGDTSERSPDDSVQTYRYLANGVRMYFGDVTMTGSTLSNIIDIPEPETEDANA